LDVTLVVEASSGSLMSISSSEKALATVAEAVGIDALGGGEEDSMIGSTDACRCVFFR
jgi:hypothetical protein